MPRLARIGVRLVLANFAVGAVLGFCMMLVRSGMVRWDWVALRQVHMWIMLYGWLTQMVFVVGYWIFPRLPGRSRGDTRPMVAALVCMNGSVAAIATGSGLLAACLLVSAVGAWVVHIGPRIARLSPMEMYKEGSHG